jgi:hypothetical protein
VARINVSLTVSFASPGVAGTLMRPGAGPGWVTDSCQRTVLRVEHIERRRRVDEGDILDVAGTVQPYLEQLVGEDALKYDRRIAGLLAAAHGGREIGNELVFTLSRSAELQAWAARVLSDKRHRSPGLQQVEERSYESLPTRNRRASPRGGSAPPQGGYVWWRRFIDQGPPRCPSDGSALAPCDR